MTKTLRLFHMFVLVTLGVALATSGFAHRFDDPSGQELVAFLDKWGLDASDVCGDIEASVTHDCEACHLQAACALPAPPVTSIILEFGLIPEDWAHVKQVFWTDTVGSIHPARAPPLV